MSVNGEKDLNKTNIISLSKDTLYYLTNYFPLAFSFAICFGLRATVGILLSCIAIIFAPDLNNKKIMPIYISFLILGCNLPNAFGASLICGVLLIISAFFRDKLNKLFCSPVISGIMLATALTVTVLFTTDYFGIGATGKNVTEMIRSYISLGFHPNWRGVLYGTIVLVLMITFPRKFKTISMFVSAPFIALIFTLILNLFLNPSDMMTAINEIPYSDTEWLKEYIVNRTNINFNIDTVICGFSLFIMCFYALSTNENSTRNDYILSGAANSLISGLLGLPLPYGINRKNNTLPARLIAVTLLLFLFFLFNDTVLRIPVHSCAVVIIVGAWESVKWKDIKNTFCGILPILCFTLSITACLLTNIASGIIISLFVSIFCCLLSNKNNKAISDLR